MAKLERAGWVFLGSIFVFDLILRASCNSEVLEFRSGNYGGDRVSSFVNQKETWGLFRPPIWTMEETGSPSSSTGIVANRIRRRLLFQRSLQEVWVAVLNITGPLSNWSFADNKLPPPETINGGPPSYILRLSGSSHENWTFWLEANSSEHLRVDVAVLDQVLADEANKLKGLFPNWVDVTAYSSFLSSYLF